MHTVYALSSGHGTCGVSVIRVTGSLAGRALMALTNTSKLPPPRQAQLKKLVHPSSKEVLDQALTLWFPAPKSFTGEDSAELQVHGGYAVVKAVLSALSSLPGLHPAQEGDFTKRAFHNGKLDLLQVEGLADLIHAETEKQRKVAVRQLHGSLTKPFEAWRNQLIQMMAQVEAYIDFAESEDIEDSVPDQVRDGVLEMLNDMRQFMSGARSGERIREGVRVAIVGQPNVGKSTLLNRLVNRPAAIVSAIPGTTRDIIEAKFDLQGYPVVILDTAGLRSKVQDIVEEEGVKRAIGVANEADVVVFVRDSVDETVDFGTFGLTRSPGQSTIQLINKSDLFSPHTTSQDLLAISALNGDGIDKFLDKLLNIVQELCGKSAMDCPGLTRERHRLHLQKAMDHLKEYLRMEVMGTDLVICAHQLRKAVREIGFVSGRVSSEQILDVIFADFCIGK